MRLGHCLGYIQGYVDGITVVANYGPKSTNVKPFGFDISCIADTVTTVQTGRITLKFIRNHPESAHKPTVWQISAALAEAFPCKQ
jgi:hypothetical protein